MSIGLLLFLLAAGIAPYWLYRNQEMLVRTAVRQLNEQQVGHLTFAASKISPFRQFPYISIELDSIYFYEHDSLEREESAIYFINELYLGFDAWKILKGAFHIRELTVDGGFIRLVTDSTGQLNLMLAKSYGEEVRPEEESHSADITLDIDQLQLRNFTIDKTDHQLKQHYDLLVERADLSLRYGQDSIEGRLEAKTNIGDFQVENAHFLQNKQLDLHFSGSYVQESGLLTLYRSSLDLNGVALDLNGTVNTADSLWMDLKLKGQKDDFDLLLAFAPDNIREQVGNFQNEGDIYFIGKITGPGQHDLPAVDLEFGCENAWFLNPNSARKVDKLNFRGFFTMGSEQNLRTAELKIENLNAQPGEGQFRGSFHVRDFIKPQVAVDLHARLDMAEVSELLNLRNTADIKGEVILDIMLDEMVDPDNLDALAARLQQGTDSKLMFRNFSLQAPWLPYQVQQVNGAMHLENGGLELDSMAIRIDDSDLNLHGTVSHLLPFLHGEPGEMVISLDGYAKRLDLEKLLATDSSASPVQDVITDLRFGVHFDTRSEYLQSFAYMPQGEFFIDSFHCRLQGFPHALHDFTADILVNDQAIQVKDFRGEIDNSDFRLTAMMKGVDYLQRTDTIAPLAFSLDLQSDHLHLRDLLTYQGVEYLPEDYREESLSELTIRARAATTNQALSSKQMLPDFSLDLEDVHFLLRSHRRKFKDIHAKLSAQSGDLRIDNFSGRLGSSDFRLNGQVKGLNDTLQAPAYNLSLHAERLDFDELLDYQPTDEAVAHDSAYNVFAEPFPNVTFEADVDELIYHRFHFKELYGRTRVTPDHYIYLDTLQAKGADGDFGLKGYFNGSDPENIYMSSDLSLRDMDIDQLFFKFDNFGQDYLLSENLHGHLTADIKATVRMHPDFTPIIEETEAHVAARINDGSIVDYAPLHAMSDYFADKDLDSVRFGELVNTLDLKDGTLQIPNMTITSTLGFMDLSGRQAMEGDMAMDYLVRIPLKMVKKAAFDRVFRRNREDDGQADEIIEDPGKGLRIPIRVTGTPDAYEIKTGKGKMR